jgi:solute carrier family 13 (sodium-dependent dicarboxylate transporter), member 2/3/5
VVHGRSDRLALQHPGGHRHPGLLCARLDQLPHDCDKFPWESWIVFGAGVSLGVSMLDSGAGRFLAETFLPILDGRSTFVVYYGIGLFGSFLSSFMANSAAVALMLPIVLPMAELMEMSPQSVTMIAPMTTSFIMLVIGCPPTIIAYSTGYFTQKEFIKWPFPGA